MKPTAITAAWQGTHRCQQCAIRNSALFANLVVEDFQRIHLPIDELQFHRSALIYTAGTETDYVMTLRTGLVKLVQNSASGQQRIVRLLRPGDLLALERLNNSVTQYDAVALNDVEVCRIPLAVISSLQSGSPTLYQQLMKQWHRAWSDASTWLADLSTGTARHRVARLLLLLDSNAVENRFFLPSREEMGAILGITTESTSKVTAEFKRQGWLVTREAHTASLQRKAIENLLK